MNSPGLTLLSASLLLALLLGGCAGLPGTVREAAPERVAAIAALEAAERYPEAAEAWLALAAEYRGELADDMRLRAAEAYLDAGRVDAAREIFAGVTAAADGTEVEARRRLVAARLALLDEAPRQALDLLAGALVPGLEADVHETRAQALAALEQPVAAARQRVLRALYLTRAEVAAENRRRIWGLLEDVPPERLDAARPPAPDTLGGWMELALIAQRDAAYSEPLTESLARWRTRYPGHPGGVEIVPELLEAARRLAEKPAHVALLLPEQGPFAAAAAAVRDGFLAAWYADTSTDRPLVTLHPEAPEDPWPAYRDAVEAGAEMIIGPLDKSSLERLAAAETLPVPTVALNYLPGGTDTQLPLKLVQFGLSPEDEAREVARGAWLRGGTQALTLHPETGWGERTAGAFGAAWEETGGMVLEQAGYGGSAQDISTAVATALNITDSEQRARDLRATLRRSLEFEPRRRQDTDLVFMAAFPTEGRQLRPQLRFHRAGDLPVYATSHVYAGSEDPRRDHDLNGVIFVDMPWVLAPARAASGLRPRLEAAWPERAAGFSRLFALGVDAYTLSGELARLRAYPAARVDGATGRLGLDARSRVHRELWWARFEDGLPVVLEPDQEIASGAPVPVEGGQPLAPRGTEAGRTALPADAR